MSIRRRNEIKRKIFPFIIIGAIVGIVLIIGAFIRIEPKNTGQEVISQTEGVADNQIASNEVTLSNLSLKMPTGWNEVKEENTEAVENKNFIHSASNSGIYIDKYEYKPEVNYMTTQEGAATFVPQGSTLTDYKTNGQNEGTIYYESPSNAGTYYCAQKYIWDKDEIYIITANINSMYYDRLADSMNFVLNSTKFNAPNPIANDTYINYVADYNCEYGLPLNWQEDSGVLTNGTDTLSIFTTSKEKDFDFSTYNTLAFNNDFKIQDAIITSLNRQDDYYVADGEISNQGGKIRVYIVSPEKNGNKYLIGFIWRYTDENTIAESCIKEYRTFKEDTTETNQTTESNNQTESQTEPAQTDSQENTSQKTNP